MLVDLARDLTGRKQRLYLGCEDDDACMAGVSGIIVKRFDSNSIPRAEQGSSPLVPDAECEHAPQLIYTAFAQNAIGPENRLRITR